MSTISFGQINKKPLQTSLKHPRFVLKKWNVPDGHWYHSSNFVFQISLLLWLMLLSFFSKKVQDSMYSSNRFKFGVKGKLKKNVPDPQLWHVSMTETFLYFFPFFFFYLHSGCRSNQCNQYINGKCGNERVTNEVCTEQANKCHFF